jgi:hypothetical protein
MWGHNKETEKQAATIHPSKNEGVENDSFFIIIFLFFPGELW